MLKKAKNKKRQVLPPEQRRRAILKAAAKVFSEKGYHKTRISDIAARANMGHGTVYRFFKSKRELAAHVVGARGAAGFLEMLGEKPLGDYDPEDLLTAIGESYLGNMKERLPIVRFSITEVLSDKDLAKGYYDHLLVPLFAGLVRAMSVFQKKGTFREIDPFMLSHLFYGMLFGYMYAQELLYGKDKTQMSKDKLIAQAVDVFLHGVLQDQKQDTAEG